jgi:hypothetical protein
MTAIQNNPYTFTWGGKLRNDYRDILDAVNKDGTRMITEQQAKKLMKDYSKYMR